MSEIIPTPGNKCQGKFANGSKNFTLYCQKEVDNNGVPVHTCVKWKRFSANCRKSNVSCSGGSEAWLAAVTVCNQKMY